MSLSVASAADRIAVSEDGNYHDRDDICSAAIMIAILSKTGNAAKVVYYGYNDHYWLSDSTREPLMRTSAEQTAAIWGGFTAGAFYDVTANRTAAVNALSSAINASNASNRLTIIAAGPMQVVGLAIAQANASARPFVTVVSHSYWNDTHAAVSGASEGLSSPRYSYTMLGGMGAKLDHIKDQNAGLDKPYSEFYWLRDSTNAKLNWLWLRSQVAAKSTFDCSDAGMAYYVTTGDDSATPAKLQAMLGGASPTPTPSPTSTPRPTPTPTPRPTATPTPRPSATPSPTSTPRPTPSPTPRPTATPSITPTPQPTASPSPSANPAQAVTSFTLIDAQTNQPIAGYGSLGDGAVINLNSLPASHLNIRANTNTGAVGSVRFALDGNARVQVENVAPFALFGDQNGNYENGTLSTGRHSLIATPFTQKSAAGTAGRSLAILFTVTNDGGGGFENGSGLAYIGPNREEVICGFVIAGTESKRMVLRALGGSLARFGVENCLPDPSLELRDARGAVVASNDNWRDSQAPLFNGSYHAFRPLDDRDPAIAIDLPPGAYSAIVRGSANTSGKVLAEIYDVSGNQSAGVTNVSTRAFVPLHDALIGGFIINGTTPTKMILRALGPSLIPYGISNVLTSPTLSIYDSHGNLVSYNDHWTANASQSAQLLQSGFAPRSPSESASVLTLPPGRYTAVIRDKNDSEGTALFDIYQAP